MRLMQNGFPVPTRPGSNADAYFNWVNTFRAVPAAIWLRHAAAIAVITTVYMPF